MPHRPCRDRILRMLRRQMCRGLRPEEWLHYGRGHWSVARESVHSPTLEKRRGMLESSAFGYRPHPPGHLVVFKYSNSTGKTARAVTMSGAFDALRVEHQDFFLSAAGPIPNCTSGGPG
jgi:hypothetical protein